MPGWLRLASVRASRSKRALLSSSSKNFSGRTFSATARSMRVSFAL